MSYKIEVIDLKKKLGGKQVLDGLSVGIGEGESFVLLGRSGVGKSVLLKHLVGIMTADSGEIWIDGFKADYDKPETSSRLRRKFGMLFQGGALFDSLSVGENILFALRQLIPDMPHARMTERMKESLRLVELPDVEEFNIPELSGGMMKRVALARAIAAEPEIILFDEPTTGLDPITTATINELIVSLKKKLATTFVVVTHDIASARTIADRIGMVHKGKLIFLGSRAEMDTTDNPYVRQFVEGSSSGPITEEDIGMEAELYRTVLEKHQKQSRRR